MLLEIATFNIESAILAANTGADRIELCENPAYGGTTASYGTLRFAIEKIKIPVFPIIRPRGGDFLYSDSEFSIMKQDVEIAKSMGYGGVVLGLLNNDGTIDFPRTAELVELAHPMEVTFHRAFDRALDPFQALEKIIQTGCKRILTSGQVPVAMEGKELIRQLVVQAGNKIKIMPGSGVRSDNILDLVKATGATELHSSARKIESSHMLYHKENMKEMLHTLTIDADEIQRMKKILQDL